MTPSSAFLRSPAPSSITPPYHPSLISNHIYAFPSPTTPGLLSVLGDLLNDAVAEKRSRREKWRVRECVALCVKMVASAPHIQGQAMDDVQVRARI